MQGAAGTLEVKVAMGEVLRLRDARGCGVRIQSGRVWITEESDSRDVMLTAEMQYRIARDGLTLLQAFRESRLTISPPQVAGRRLELGTVGASSQARDFVVEAAA